MTHEKGSPHSQCNPSIDIHPAAVGVDIVVRYVTRAGVRLETREPTF